MEMKVSAGACSTYVIKEVEWGPLQRASDTFWDIVTKL